MSEQDKRERLWTGTTTTTTTPPPPPPQTNQRRRTPQSKHDQKQSQSRSLTTGIGLNGGNVRFREHPVVDLLVVEDLQEDQTVEGDLREAAEKKLKGRRAGDKVDGLVEVAEEPGEDHHATEKRGRKSMNKQKKLKIVFTSCPPWTLTCSSDRTVGLLATIQ